jgi:predicted kinase
VTALRLGQGDLEAEEREQQSAEFRKYLHLAERYTHGGTSGIIITHGASGSGKSVAARKLVMEIPAIQVRSDVERKRLAGLDSRARTHAEVAGGIYSGEFSRRTYDRLLELAEVIVAAGFVAVVDATFLRREQRRSFQELARRLEVPFLILQMQTPEALLRQRIRARLAKGVDPSEADEAVLSRQLEQMEPLVEEESACVIALAPDEPLPLAELNKRLSAGV